VTDRPEPLERLDGYFAAARIAHEYISDMHRELVELDAADEQSRELLHESVAVTLERMPTLTRRLRALEREWAEQELLDPPAAERTIMRMDGDLAELMPAIAELRARQDQIAVQLLDRVSQAR
jgi:predicted metal-dependent hydrolase